MNPNSNDFNFSRQFRPPGMAGATTAPMNVRDVAESDSPPGAPGYSGGPLANPKPSPTPQQPSLTQLAAGGNNHQEAWMSGQATPTALPQQAPFVATESDSPPGAPGYASGPLANPPKPTPTPKPNANFVKRFSFSSAFDEQPAY